jgi:hypothetical protein
MYLHKKHYRIFKNNYASFSFLKFNIRLFTQKNLIFLDMWNLFFFTKKKILFFLNKIKLSYFKLRLTQLNKQYYFLKTNKIFKNLYSNVLYKDSPFINKCLYFNIDWYIVITKVRKLNKKYLRRKYKKKGYLHITFSRRNMFINLALNKKKTLFVNTLRRLGFLGRRRREYTSIFGAIRIIRKNIKKYKIKRLVLIYRG